MSLCTSTVWPQALIAFRAVKSIPSITSRTSSPLQIPFCNTNSKFPSKPCVPFSRNHNCLLQSQCFAARKSESNAVPDDGLSPNSQSKPKKRRSHKSKAVHKNETEDAAKTFPATIPRKRRRGRRSEAAAVEDFVRDLLERTFASMRVQNPDVCIEKERIFKERMNTESNSDISDDDGDDWDGERPRVMVIKEESSSWPLDADVGWGIRASEYLRNMLLTMLLVKMGLK